MQRMRASLAWVCASATRVCLCVYEQRVHLPSMTMHVSESKSLFLFLNSLRNVFISSDSVMEIEMPYGATTGEELKW